MKKINTLVNRTFMFTKDFSYGNEPNKVVIKKDSVISVLFNGTVHLEGCMLPNQSKWLSFISDEIDKPSYLKELKIKKSSNE